jgi:hypothetical protein
MFRLLNLRANDQETIDECENVLVWHIIGDLNNLKIFHSLYQQRMSQELGLHIQGKGRSSKIQSSRSVHKKEQAWPLPQAFSIPLFFASKFQFQRQRWLLALKQKARQAQVNGEWGKKRGWVGRPERGPTRKWWGPQSGEEIEKDWTPSILGW